jgi:hypothetical protein
MREMVEPTSALDMMVDEGIRSMFGQLAEIVRHLMPESVREETVLAVSRSVISQCLFYLFSRAVISRMAPEFDPEHTERIADEVLTFSLLAIEGFSRRHG